MNDLTKQMKECKAFGYSDDYKQVSSKADSIQKDLLNIGKWCSKIEMNINESKCHILPVKAYENKEQAFTLNSRCLLDKKNRKL